MGRRHSCWAQCQFNAVRSADCKRWGMQSNGAVHFRRWLHLGGPVPSVLLKVADHGVDRVFFMDTGRAGRQNGVPMRVEPPVLVQVILGVASHLGVPAAGWLSPSVHMTCVRQICAFFCSPRPAPEALWAD